MTARLAMTVADPRLDADGTAPEDLVFGLTATLQISQAGRVWRAEYSPVLELAIELAQTSCSVPYSFNSMSIEEEPVLGVELIEDALVLVTYDGERCVAPEDELREALRQFVTDVDDTVRRLCGRKLTDIERSLRPR